MTKFIDCPQSRFDTLQRCLHRSSPLNADQSANRVLAPSTSPAAPTFDARPVLRLTFVPVRRHPPSPVPGQSTHLPPQNISHPTRETAVYTFRLPNGWVFCGNGRLTFEVPLRQMRGAVGRCDHASHELRSLLLRKAEQFEENSLHATRSRKERKM